MSTFSCPIVEFTLDKHPDADSLSIAFIKGWQCVVRTADFVNEKLGVYIPLDAVAGKDHPLLGFMEGKRVKTIKLRKVLSQGILLPFSKVEEYMNSICLHFSYEVGMDLSEYLKVKKYEAPVNHNLGSCNQISEPTDFHHYTDIENIKNFTDVLNSGEFVWVTEKIHGTSARYGILNKQFFIGSRQRCLELEPAKETVWHMIAKKYNLREVIEEISLGEDDVIVYGEIAGRGVQDLQYGNEQPEFYVYDVSIGGKYIPSRSLDVLCQSYKLPRVPVLAKEVPFSEDLLQLRFGQTTLNGGPHVREGIVIEPSEPRFDKSLGRVKLKCVSEEYLQRKGGSDFEG